MNKRKIALGPGAASIILIVVSLALCMLAMLTLITAKNDLNLSRRSSEMIEQVYELSAQSERSFAELDSILLNCEAESQDLEAFYHMVEEQLPDGMMLEGDRISWYEQLENRMLECSVKLAVPGENPRAEWISHRLIVQEPEDDWEWD